MDANTIRIICAVVALALRCNILAFVSQAAITAIRTVADLCMD